MGTPHIEAKRGEIAETILLPGDPLRAKHIAETFFENVMQYNGVRGMSGFTGTYKGKKVSVQGTGMGTPSTGIYSHELITEYRVKNLIRVGTAGSFQKDLKVRDIVMAISSSTESNINKLRFNGADYAPTASPDLLFRTYKTAKLKKINIRAGNILSTDTFYDYEPEHWKKWAKFGVLCVEMETAQLYTTAAKFGVNALTLLTICDSLVTGEATSSKERQSDFNEMVELALESILEQ